VSAEVETWKVSRKDGGVGRHAYAWW